MSRHLVPLLACLTIVTGSPVLEAVQSSSTSEAAQQRQRAQQALTTARKRLAIDTVARDAARQQVAELQEKLNAASQRLQAAQQQLTANEQAITPLESALAEAETLLQAHRAADRLQEQADAITGRRDALVEQRARLKDDEKQLVRQSLQWQAGIAAARKKIAEVDAKLAGLRENVTRSAEAAKAAQDAIAGAEAALAGQQQMLQQKTAEADVTQKQQQDAARAEASLQHSSQALSESLKKLEEAGATGGLSLDETETSVRTARDSLTVQITRAAELRTMLDNRLKEQQAAVNAQQEAVAAATTALQQARTAGEQPIANASQAVSAVQAAEAELAEARETLTRSTLARETVSAQISGLEPSLQKLDAQIAMVDREVAIASTRAENALEPLGRFVSFSRTVAPIFAERCIACHNTRNSGGRLNLQSYAHILKGGESGPSFESRDADESLLYLMVEDGSMPKDAEPLTEDEMAALRRWIEVGAPLDAGVVATAELFDVMPEVQQPLPPETYRVPIPVTATEFSPDGSILATSGYHEVLLWNTETGALLQRISNVAERVYDLDFSTDGQLLLVAAGTPGQLGEAKLFHTADGRYVRTLIRAKDALFGATFSPDDTAVATAGADRAVNIVATSDGARLLRIDDHADWVMSVSWSPDGQQLVTSSRDKTCKVFAAETGQAVVTFKSHTETTYSAVFLPDGQRVASSGGDNRLRIWNVGDGKQVREIGGFGDDVFSVVLTDSGSLLTASADRTAREHNPADGKLLRTYAGHTDWVYAVAVSPTAKKIATGSLDGEVRLWNAEDATLQSTFLAVPHSTEESSVAASE